MHQILFAGSKRHAKDMICLIDDFEYNIVVNVFDDVSSNFHDSIKTNGKLFDNLFLLNDYIKINPEFVLALGGTDNRKILANKLINVGGVLISIISKKAVISSFNVKLDDGVSIMPFVFVGSNVCIGKGSLINTNASIHHDVVIGEFCEISPGARVLGGVEIGDLTSVGSGAIILPNVTIGNNVVIGAGSVVTKNITDNSLVYGVPAKLVEKK